MELRLDRKWKKEDYTIGELYINNTFFCHVLEDKDRGLDQNQSVDYIKRIKIPNSTAIPTGRYNIKLDIVSPKYSDYKRYPWAKEIGGKVPRLIDVPGFEGILIHIGNSNQDSSGCLLVGVNSTKGQVTDSTKTFQKLYSLLLTDKDNIWIEIE